MRIKSTKKFVNMPVAHCQYFDLEPDGSPGDCAAFHGYDRSVQLTFSGEIDDHGWIVPFGELKVVKAFLEYYFDHTSVLGADDPRLPLPESVIGPNGVLATLRVLPYGVSMEMSSMFIWEHLNPYIFQVTSGRCVIVNVESIEHERNSAWFETDETHAMAQAENYLASGVELLPKKRIWEFEKPKDAFARLSNG